MASEKKIFIYDEKKKKCVQVFAPTEKHQGRGQWPIVSESMGVDPGDVGKAQAILKQKGVHTDYTKTGEPILRDRQHRMAHCRAMGFFDRNSYGGRYDVQPLNR
jgi:hypothetical protein